MLRGLAVLGLILNKPLRSSRVGNIVLKHYVNSMLFMLQSVMVERSSGARTDLK